MEDIPDLTDDGPLRFSSFVETEGAYEVSEAEDLAALDLHHMWTPEYAESRFKWRPKKPLTVLVLRAFLLPEMVELPYREEYGGCNPGSSCLRPSPSRVASGTLGRGVRGFDLPCGQGAAGSRARAGRVLR